MHRKRCTVSIQHRASGSCLYVFINESWLQGMWVGRSTETLITGGGSQSRRIIQLASNLCCHAERPLASGFPFSTLSNGSKQHQCRIHTICTYHPCTAIVIETPTINVCVDFQIRYIQHMEKGVLSLSCKATCWHIFACKSHSGIPVVSAL